MSIHELNGRFGNQNEVAAGEQAKGYKSPCVNSSPPAIAIVSSKENGLAKGLSSNSRKVEEKTFDEIEKEKRTSERIAKRQEGKASFGNKSEDALRRYVDIFMSVLIFVLSFIYFNIRTMITNDEEEDTDEHNSDVSADDEEELEDLDDEGEGEEHGEKDPAEMTAMAKSFAINTKKEVRPNRKLHIHDFYLIKDSHFSLVQTADAMHCSLFFEETRCTWPTSGILIAF